MTPDQKIRQHPIKPKSERTKLVIDILISFERILKIINKITRMYILTRKHRQPMVIWLVEFKPVATTSVCTTVVSMLKTDVSDYEGLQSEMSVLKLFITTV